MSIKQYVEKRKEQYGKYKAMYDEYKTKKQKKETARDLAKIAELRRETELAKAKYDRQKEINKLQKQKTKYTQTSSSNDILGNISSSSSGDMFGGMFGGGSSSGDMFGDMFGGGSSCKPKRKTKRKRKKR